MYFNWISTTSFVALNKRWVKNTRFNSITRNTKLIQHWILTSFVLQLGRIGHFEKQINIISIKHLKQTLSLENN